MPNYKNYKNIINNKYHKQMTNAKKKTHTAQQHTQNIYYLCSVSILMQK